jgi:energy-converting hydrogenase Eha subunit E
MALAQGVIYVVSGVWPIVHLPSFETVTGPKVDGWLVKTVGAMIATVGVVLLSAAKRDRVTPEIAALGAGCAASLAAIDVVYVTRGRISPIYLADAVMEAGIIAGWAMSRKRRAKPAAL